MNTFVKQLIAADVFYKGHQTFKKKKGFNFKLEDLEHLLKAQLAHSEKR